MVVIVAVGSKSHNILRIGTEEVHYEDRGRGKNEAEPPASG